MLKSMTGYGRGAYDDNNFSFAIEIKTVNHRYNEIAIRLPRFLNPLEDKIRKAILSKINRGRVDVFIVANYTAGENCQVKVDKNLAKAYNNALQDIAAAAGIQEAQLNEGARLLYLAKCPEVISAKEGFFDVDALWPQVEGAMNEALDHLLAMRLTEGNNISGDIVKRAEFIADKLADIEERAPLVVTDYQTKLNERIEELLKGSGQVVDQERIIQEVAIFADRVNITEEIVRLKSHLKQFGEMLQSTKPIGRKMDFLVQEFNREANTIASKSNDLTITRLTVEIKGEIEKIREQIQNIE